MIAVLPRAMMAPWQRRVSDMLEAPMTDMFRQVLRGARKTFRRRYLAQAGLLGILVILALALLAPVIAPQDPYDQMQLDIMNGLLPPGSEMMDGSIAYLGTDSLGRDILSAVLYGSRTSLMVAVIAVAIGTSAGVLLGLLSALRGGWIDTIIMRAVDLTVSFPGVLLAIMLLAIFGAGVDKVILALSIGIWAQAARLVRAIGQSEMKRDYIAAARLGGIKVCCGGIRGMGEAEEDRIAILVTLATLPAHPDSVPVNLWNEIEGVPVQVRAQAVDPFALVRIVALARILMPASVVRLSAGRTGMSDELQALCFLAGASSIFVGDQLLTTGNPGHGRIRTC